MSQISVGPPRAMVIKNLDLETENVPLEQALRERWSAEEDAFMFQVTTKQSMK